MKIAVLLIAILCASCTLFNGLKKKEFSYDDNGAARKMEFVVPKKYDKEEIIADSLGNKVMLYRYDDAVLYFFHGDSNSVFQPIDKGMNIPKEHPAGGWMFKGMDSSGLFWREVRQGAFRAGYWNIGYGTEEKFDTVVNYALWKWRK